MLLAVVAVCVIGSATCAAADDRDSHPEAHANAPRAEARATTPPKRADFNRRIYYKNKLEFSLEGAWLPNNIPFVFDRMIGIPDRMTPLHYTLVPFIASVRWQMSDIKGPWIFRGNWEGSSSGSFTMIPRGPETRYWAYIMGIRRNFVQPNWRVVPYFEGRAGVGDINAKEPYGAEWAQGQDLTFTVMLDAGARYNLSPRYSFAAGAAYMHISNLYLSEPRYSNYGINVWGPMVGAYVRWGGSHNGRTAKKSRDQDQIPTGTLP
jgi:hypothetical protein